MSDDSFLREVEEELRSEKLKAFWRRYAVFIIGGAVLIVLIVAANEGWKWWRASTANTASERYYAAVSLADQGDLDGARTSLQEIVADGPSGYATLAQFRIAGLLAEQGDPQSAIAAYDALASSLEEPRLRELALVSAAYLAVDHSDLAGVEMRAGGLTGPESPMRNQALEALGLAHYRAGDIEAARGRFEEIAADPNTTQDMQMRAHLYLEQLMAQGVDVSEQVLEPDQPMDIEALQDELGVPLDEFEESPPAEAPADVDEAPPAETEPDAEE